jgi:hypothetical protein
MSIFQIKGFSTVSLGSYSIKLAPSRNVNDEKEKVTITDAVLL